MSNQLAAAVRFLLATSGPKTGQQYECWKSLKEALAAHEAAKPAEPFGYVSEHNCEGPHQFQFHNSLSSIYWDNCKNFTAVYAAPAHGIKEQA